MFAYTDCIPQVCDELIKIHLPSLMAELALPPAGDRGNSPGAARSEAPPPQARTVLPGFSWSQQKQRWPISVTAADTWAAPMNCRNYRRPGGFLQKIGSAWERLKLVQSSSLGNVVESISFRVLEGILSWSHWASKFQCLQYCRIWTGKQPRRVMFLHNNYFFNCRRVQQRRFDDCGRLFTDLSGCILLLNSMPQADTISWGLGFCVHVWFFVCMFCLLFLVGLGFLVFLT